MAHEEESEGDIFDFLNKLTDTTVKATTAFATVKDTLEGTEDPVKELADASAGSIDSGGGGPSIEPGIGFPKDFTEVQQFFSRNAGTLIIGVITILVAAGVIRAISVGK